jgi:hypothetical protein
MDSEELYKKAEMDEIENYLGQEKLKLESLSTCK